MEKIKSVETATVETDKEIPNMPKIKPKTRGRKRKRIYSQSSSDIEDVLPDNTLEVEKNVHASAIKNNLDDTSVRKILKKVVTNDHVLALVKLREEEEDSGNEESGHAPKLTRSKVKELKKVSQKSTWNLENLELTPIKLIPVKTRPEVKALIAQELPEDEDDEEYEPTHDDVPSDDDQTLESCSDLDSQPRTPATPKTQATASPKVVKDGPFKVPQANVSIAAKRKLDMEEEATIALRTRSKLSLSETPIEHIESSFVPPDDLPMPAVDDLWNKFLEECLNPAPSSKHEDDDEADPEYNVAADPDAPDEDEEALESIIKISKKELSDLVTELFYIMPEATTDDELAVNMANELTANDQPKVPTTWEGKQEPLSDNDNESQKVQPAKNVSDRITFEKGSHTKLSIGKIEPEDNPEYEESNEENINASCPSQEVNQDSVQQSQVHKPVVKIAVLEQSVSVLPPPTVPDPPPAVRAALSPPRTVLVNQAECRVILPEQILILQQQLRMHIQLATSNFLQLFIHPAHWTFGPTYKEFLETLYSIGESNPKSVVNVCNLKPAVELIRIWEQTVSKDTPANAAMVKFIQEEGERSRRRLIQNNMYVGDFHPTMKEVVANSTVFVYPHLLPPVPYRLDLTRRYSYMQHEDELMALTLDQFWSYVEDNPLLFKRPSHWHGRWGLSAAVALMSQHVFTWLSPRIIHSHISHCRRDRLGTNPIYRYFKTREVKPVEHKLLPFDPQRTLYEQPEHEVPRVWVRYLAKNNSRFRTHLYRAKKKQLVQPEPEGVPVRFVFPGKPDTQENEPKPDQNQNRPTQIFVVEPAKISQPQPVVSVNMLPPVSANIFTLVETSTGAKLIPLSLTTTTVNSTITPITSVVQPQDSITKPVPIKKDVIPLEEHCKCCILLRKICKQRQTFITDYFKSNERRKVCYCKNVQKYPKISNRLKLLMYRYKSVVGRSFYKLQLKLNSLKKEIREEIIEKTTEDNKTEIESDSSRLGSKLKCISKMDDLAFVTEYQSKLTLRTMVAKNNTIKNKVYRLFTKFDILGGDPIRLADELYKVLGIELVDLYKEFLCFLTPEQADSIGKFKDYFVQTHLPNFVKLVEEHVSDKRQKYRILCAVQNVYSQAGANACSVCSAVLATLEYYPALAQHFFQLFPHRQRAREDDQETKLKSNMTTPMEEKKQMNEEMEKEADDTLVEGDGTHTMDYEADNSSSGEEDGHSDTTILEGADPAINDQDIKSQTPDVSMINGRCFNDKDEAPSDTETISTHQNAKRQLPDVIVKIESQNENVIDTPELTISKTEVQDYSESDVSMMIVSEDEIVKSEAPEWKRDEDKLILEILKENLTPEERKDKTITEIADEKSVLDTLSQCLSHKSIDDIRERVMYLLKLLIISEN
ncbi:uncharacterized protein LOC113521902 isoform X2 [Galleria mellonella]|uniref:Uncharacterized protein LOC113521902 isoform X2 n=1 Tax=Galleria mellonella TaxID=7137 RepID=A0A6J1X887_GALME|nr:uncharacterized protein LOC113521902 isoform X2 [Galleria mellonella]